MSEARQVTASFGLKPVDPDPDPVPGVGVAFLKGDVLTVRLKCPARFKPACRGFAQVVSGKSRKARVMSSKVKAGQKAGKWKVVKLKIKPAYLKKVRSFARTPSKRRLVVKQTISARKLKGGKRQSVFHRYKVRPQPAT